MKKYLTLKNKLGYSNILVVLFVMVALLIALFLFTKGGNPSTSELRFTEKSMVGNNAGSVLPASCESGYDHSTGIACPVSVQLYFQ